MNLDSPPGGGYIDWHRKPKGDNMRHGYRGIDVDTHVNPSWDVLSRYGDKDLREHLDDLNAN